MDRINKPEEYITDTLGDFAYIRIPKSFVNGQFASLSLAAKFLYGLILDRIRLSVQNEWLDDDNVPYAYYSVDNAAKDLGCGRAYTIRVFQELEAAKLIIRKRQGNGKPSKVYISSFQMYSTDTSDEQMSSSCTTENNQMSPRSTSASANRYSTDTTEPYQMSSRSTSEGADVSQEYPRSLPERLCEVSEGYPNKNNKNNNKYNNTLIGSGEIRRDVTAPNSTSCQSENLPEEKRNNFGDVDNELTRSVVDIVDSVLRSTGSYIRVAGSLKSLSAIKKLFADITAEHINEAVKRISRQPQRPTDLYEAVVETLFYIMRSPKETA